MTHTWSWRLLRAGSFRLDGGSMFGVVPKSIWSKLSPPDEGNRIPLQTNCLLLEDGQTRVLIETGFGGKWTDKERGFYDLQRRTIVDALAEIGVAPQQIDHIVLTHLHFDHAGGLTHLDASGNASSTFPRATIHVQQREWEDALANRSTMTRTYLRNHLDPIQNQIALLTGEAEAWPGSSILVAPMPGHTWGQQLVRFNDGQGVVCFPGDVMPTGQHVGLAFSMGYDMEPYTNMLSKRALLERAAEEDWRLALDHEPGHAVVRVEAESGGRFRLVNAPSS